MKINTVIMLYSILVMSYIPVNAQEIESNSSTIDVKSYSRMTSKGKRKYIKSNYDEFSSIQTDVSKQKAPLLGHRGTRLDLNTLPATSAGSKKANKAMKSRGTRHNKC